MDKESSLCGGEHRKNTDNLRPPWKPGESGNPKGRPKGVSLTDLLRKVFEESPEKMRAFVERTVELAMQGQAPYAKEVWERMDGKVSDRVEISGPIALQWPHEMASKGRAAEEDADSLAGEEESGAADADPD